MTSTTIPRRYVTPYPPPVTKTLSCGPTSVSEMTYTVSSGTLNPSIPYHVAPPETAGSTTGCFLPCAKFSAVDASPTYCTTMYSGFSSSALLYIDKLPEGLVAASRDNVVKVNFPDDRFLLRNGRRPVLPPSVAICSPVRA